MRILQVTAEIFPLLKTGGLADIAGALPLALMAQGQDVRALLPGFPAIAGGVKHSATIAELDTPWGDRVGLRLSPKGLVLLEMSLVGECRGWMDKAIGLLPGCRRGTRREMGLQALLVQ